MLLPFRQNQRKLDEILIFFGYETHGLMFLALLESSISQMNSDSYERTVISKQKLFCHGWIKDDQIIFFMLMAAK